MIFDTLKEEFMGSIISKIAALMLKPNFRNIKRKFDYTEYGGAAFLGINGGVIKAHGSSNAKAFKNAIRQAKLFVENEVLSQIKNNIVIEENIEAKEE
jgi:glycerol-3-phosphate acyltransferase PlsX